MPGHRPVRSGPVFATAASGRITGKPRGSGAFQVTAAASDATGATAGTTFTLTLGWF